MEELRNFVLWGTDLDLGSMAHAEWLMEAMPAYEVGLTSMLALRPGWEDGNRDTMPAFKAHSFPLLCADQVAVSEGSVIVVMGGRFALHVHDLGCEIGDGWIRVQNGYTIHVMTPVESRMIRLRLAERARNECVVMFRSAHDGRIRGARKNPTLMRRLGWTTDVAAHAGHYDDIECYHLMLAVGAAIGIEECDWLARLQASAEHLRMRPEVLARSVNEWIRIIIHER